MGAHSSIRPASVRREHYRRQWRSRGDIAAVDGVGRTLCEHNESAVQSLWGWARGGARLSVHALLDAKSGERQCSCGSKLPRQRSEPFASTSEPFASTSESFANTSEPCASAWSSPTILAPLRGRQDEHKKQCPAFADEVWLELFSRIATCKRLQPHPFSAVVLVMPLSWGL